MNNDLNTKIELHLTPLYPQQNLFESINEKIAIIVMIVNSHLLFITILLIVFLSDGQAIIPPTVEDGPSQTLHAFLPPPAIPIPTTAQSLTDSQRLIDFRTFPVVTDGQFALPIEGAAAFENPNSDTLVAFFAGFAGEKIRTNGKEPIGSSSCENAFVYIEASQLSDSIHFPMDIQAEYIVQTMKCGLFNGGGAVSVWKNA